jgi:hypothetical protein
MRQCLTTHLCFRLRLYWAYHIQNALRWPYVEIIDAIYVFAKMPIKPAMLHNTALKCRNRASRSTSPAFGRAEV